MGGGSGGRREGMGGGGMKGGRGERREVGREERGGDSSLRGKEKEDI